MKVQYMIRNAMYSFRGKVWKEVSEQAKDLISKLMVSDPTKRLNIEEALAHPWLKVSVLLFSLKRRGSLSALHYCDVLRFHSACIP